MKRFLVMLTAATLLLAFPASALAAETSLSPDDVWKSLGVDPNAMPSLDSFTGKILSGFVSVVRTLSVLSIPIAVCGAIVGVLIWGVGAVSHNERVQKGGVAVVLSMCALPIVAKLAPVVVAAFARSFGG